jgi:NAD(P)-dependent dehydrogenase (short-subunit alcohol dehydrogenase family)
VAGTISEVTGAGPMSGRRVLITGAASGIGRATARAIASQGGHVVAVDVDDDAVRELVSESKGADGRLSQLHADVSREVETAKAVESAVATLGGIDALVHAAGIMLGQLEDIRTQSEETWDRVIDVNLKGAYLMAKHVAKVMIPAGSGVIILVASKAGVAVGSGSFPYGASKGGVHGLALTLERHLGPYGIRVNDVCPGDVDTPLIRGSLAEAASRGGDPVEIERTIRGLVSPDSVAELLAFLASDAASSVRGTIFTR